MHFAKEKDPKAENSCKLSFFHTIPSSLKVVPVVLTYTVVLNKTGYNCETSDIVTMDSGSDLKFCSSTCSNSLYVMIGFINGVALGEIK